MFTYFSHIKNMATGYIIQVCPGNEHDDEVNGVGRNRAIMNQVLSVISINDPQNSLHSSHSTYLCECSENITNEMNGWYLFTEIMQIDYNKIALFAIASEVDECDSFALIYQIQKNGTLSFIEINDKEFQCSEGIMSEIGFKVYENYDENSINFFDMRLNIIADSFSSNSESDCDFWVVAPNKLLLQDQNNNKIILFSINEEERSVDKIDISHLLPPERLIWDAKYLTDNISIIVGGFENECSISSIYILDLNKIKLVNIHNFSRITSHSNYIFKICSISKFLVFSWRESVAYWVSTEDYVDWSINPVYNFDYQTLNLIRKEKLEKFKEYGVGVHGAHCAHGVHGHQNQMIHVKNYVKSFEKFRKSLYLLLSNFFNCIDFFSIIYDYVPVSYILKNYPS